MSLSCPLNLFVYLSFVVGCLLLTIACGFRFKTMLWFGVTMIVLLD